MANKQQSQYQIYDNLLKRLLERHAGTIIPCLLASSGLEMVNVVEELNVEILIPPRRNDRVFRSLIKHKPHITHFEIEVSGNARMDARLLIYHALLFEKYNQPVISVIVYPFKTTMVTSPLRETSGDDELVTFHFQKIPLWELDARTYFDEHEVCMYALLPAMCGASQEMHMQAIDQMIKYYQGDDEELRNQLLCFGVMMLRAEMLSAVELGEVVKKMQNYDPFIAEDLYLQALVERLADEKAKELVEKKVEELAEELAEKKAEKMVAEARAKANTDATKAREQANADATKAREKANADAIKARAETIATFQQTLMSIVRARFPLLAERVVREVVLPDKADVLNLLIVQLSSAPDERAAQAMLGVPAAE